MKTKNTQPLHKTVIASLALAALMIGTQVQAQSKCSDLFSADTQVVTAANAGSSVLLNLKGSDFALKPAVVSKISAIYAEHDIAIGSTKARDVVEAAYKSIRGASKAPSMEKSDKMATISRKALNAVKSALSEKEFLMLNYLFAESVLRLEQIKESDFKVEQADTEAADTLQDSNVLHISQFHKYVESYVDGTDLYKNFGGNGGILAWSAIRTLYANNNWVVAFKNHDMYHLHYSYGHPYYLAVNFLTARSVNDFRYHVISSLWESVDTVRTGYESSIARYFRDKGMTSQEGMLHIATASRAELKKIEDEMNGESNNNSYYSYQERWTNDMEDATKFSKEWKPTKNSRFRNVMPTTEVYYKELEAYINKSLDLIAKPEKKRYVNYARITPGSPSPVDVTQIP